MKVGDKYHRVRAKDGRRCKESTLVTVAKIENGIVTYKMDSHINWHKDLPEREFNNQFKETK